MQFGEKLGLPQDIACLGLGSNISMDPQSSSGLSLQIDLPSFLSTSEFIVFKKVYFKSESLHVNSDGEDTRCEYEIVVPGNKVPKWFNHRSIESFISFSIGPEFPTISLCLAFGLLDDVLYEYLCDVNISINGTKRELKVRLFDAIRCDHLWFYYRPHSSLQPLFQDLNLGDRNHVEISCKISHWTSKPRQVVPIIKRLGVHVECTCPQNSHNYEGAQPRFYQISKRIVHQRLRPFLCQGPGFILRKLYHMLCPTRSTSRQPLLKAHKKKKKNSSKKNMPLGEPKSQKRSRAASNITNVSKIEDMPLGEQKIQNQFDVRMKTKRTRTS